MNGDGYGDLILGLMVILKAIKEAAAMWCLVDREWVAAEY